MSVENGRDRGRSWIQRRRWRYSSTKEITIWKSTHYTFLRAVSTPEDTLHVRHCAFLKHRRKRRPFLRLAPPPSWGSVIGTVGLRSHAAVEVGSVLPATHSVCSKSPTRGSWASQKTCRDGVLQLLPPGHHFGQYCH